MQGIGRGVNNKMRCGPRPSVARATGGMPRFRCPAQAVACVPGTGLARATKNPLARVSSSRIVVPRRGLAL